MQKDAFQALVAEVTGAIKGRALDVDLGAYLEAAFPADARAGCSSTSAEPRN